MHAAADTESDLALSLKGAEFRGKLLRDKGSLHKELGLGMLRLTLSKISKRS